MAKRGGQKKENWKKKRKQEYLEKKEFRYYIFCEGQATEPKYFQGFKRYIEDNPIYRDMVLIEIEGCQAETMRVIGRAEEYVRDNKIAKGEIWCVYDKDSFPSSDVNGVVQRTQVLNQKNPNIQYHAAWSNECIEFWFMLHFAYYTSNNHRSEYVKFLNEKFQELKDNDSEIEKIVTGDNVIEVIKNNDKYEIEYEIEEDKVTFSIEAEVKQGMSWEEYTKLFGDSTGDASDGNIEDGLAMGYYAVANILGAEYKSAAWYYTLTRIEGYKGKYAKSDKWIIMKDAEGVTEIKTDSSEEKVLNTKDFANRTMEYFNSIYKDDTYTYEDSNHCNTYKSITEKKEKTDTSCKLIEKIIINTNADFSKLKVDMDSVLDNGVTEENADYVYTLKVGQKIKFETSQKYSGYSCVGTGIELSEDKNELIATEVGTAKGNITFGNITKSFYITVEENTNNEQLEDITIKIDSDDSKIEDTKIPTTEITSKTETVKNNSDSTTAKTELPKAGINTIIYITMAIVGIAVATFIILNKKYKDIK